jgi:hypothetical protein
MSSLRRSSLTVIAITCACALVSGCSRQEAGKPPGADPDAVARYGYGPQPNPAVTYQPDVILMSAGPEIIRGVSPDGLTWTIDGNAKEARQLAPGKIMFASSRAVGRIAAIDTRGSDLVVTVLPVEFTEVIRNANLQVEQRLSSRSPLTGHVILKHPDVYAIAEPIGPARFQRVVTSTDGSTYSGAGTVRGFEVAPFIKSTSKDTEDKHESVREIGVKISRKAEDGVKFGGTFSLYGKDIRVRANIIVVDGKLADASSFVMDGVEGMDVGFVSGSDQATVIKLRLEDAMIDTGVNFLVGGVPMAITFKTKAYMEFAFSSNNSTLSAHGRYKLTGPLGFEQGAVQKPTIALEESMLQSVEGYTIGPAGVVGAVELRLLLGFGNKDAAVAGGYGKAVISVGVSQGSALGLPLAQCHGVTFKVDGGMGFGLEFNKRLFSMLELLDKRIRPQVAELKERMGKRKAKAEVDLGQEFSIVNATAYEPIFPLCIGG